MWKEPSRQLTPSIFHAKQMLRRLKEDRDVVRLYTLCLVLLYMRQASRRARDAVRAPG